MPIFQLSDEISFPPLELAEPDGLLAYGGDLHPARILRAYELGIFPWYGEDSPILWWSPDPRLVLYPSELHVSKSMRPVLRSGRFQVRFDTAFSAVINGCRIRPGSMDHGTWLTEEMVQAYNLLHQLGHAHSVEVFHDDALVGGLYGIALGRCFFGESMFSAVSNASKVGFIHLVRLLEVLGFGLIDCQVKTNHLIRLGARQIPRTRFILELRQALSQPGIAGPWTGLDAVHRLHVR